MTRRSLIVIVLCLAAALPLAGCGAEDAIAPEDIARAAQATADAGGTRFTMSGDVTAAGVKASLTGRGASDENGSSRVDVRVKRAGKEANVKTVSAGTVVYLSGDQLTADLPKGKQWMKIDYSKAKAQLGLGGLPQGSSDPRETLRNLQSVGDVQRVGQEDVRGVGTTHYKVKVDLRDLPSRVRPEDREATRRSVKRLIELTGSDETDMEVWIDDKHLVRRMRSVYSVKAGQQKADIDQTVEFFDFGARVAIEVPAQTEVFDATALATREARKQQGN